MRTLIDTIIKAFQPPTKTDTDGNILTHANYKSETPIARQGKFFQLPIARHVIDNQVITNKGDFIEFVNEYKTDGTKMFYDTHEVRAVFNYTTNETADYGDSQVKIPLYKTRDIIEYENAVDSTLSQREFIHILKRLEPYIVQFDDRAVEGMDIIEVAENLQAVKNINSIQRNTSASFVLDVEIRTGAASVEVPRYITFDIPVFKADLTLKARFRTEVFLSGDDDGFGVRLVCYDQEASIDEATREIVTQITNGCDGIPSYQVG